MQRAVGLGLGPPPNLESKMPHGWHDIAEDGTMPPPHDTALLLFTGSTYEIGHFNTLQKKWLANPNGKAITPTHWQWLPPTPSGDDWFTKGNIRALAR